MRTIEKAKAEELSAILKIYEKAKEFMVKSGNPNQWRDGYPQEEVLLDDIAQGNLYVIKENGVICAAFVLAIDNEPNYEEIEDGEWLFSGEYGTIHRVASNGEHSGIFADTLAFCERKIKHLRIDTHSDNRVMRRLIEKHGFKKCGVIRIKADDNSPRIAYEKF